VTRAVAIHQPNFLPWLGYFDKLARADVFVLLDSVQFPRSGHGEWMNRVRALVHGEPRWLTVPIRRRGVQLIRDVEIDDEQGWRQKLLRTLELSYGRAAHFAEVFPFVEEIVTNAEQRLADFNEHGIGTLANALALERAEIVRASSLHVDGAGSDLLAEITLAVGGTTYLSGGGADSYQREESYRERGIDLVFQDFEHPCYPQGVDPFVPGLSVVDALMHCGVEGVRLQLARSS
jgi:WbqC-like protein family